MQRAGWVGLTAAMALFAGPAVAHASQQFDLRCEGVATTDGQQRPWADTIRIDLAGERWCWDACERTYRIHEIAPDRLLLEQRHDRTTVVESRARLEIDRTTGQLTDWRTSIGLVTFEMRKVAQCEPREFSGFPAARF